ncbi:hypothetical protein [Streptomyces sp. NPDC088910]|uniref:hypothetical protein n=1 Tax=Streptomyces sp. NPDC088910 TaxID=3365911 RepID=UPI00382EC1E7
MFAQSLEDCPSARISEQGTLDVAVSGESIGSFASFAPAPGGQWSFTEFCKDFGSAMEISRKRSSAEGTPPAGAAG